jgi:hypothetical protein
MSLHDAAASRSNAELYRGMALSAMPRLLGTLDRESWSPTSGSFDRDHWGWHFRDFPIGMLQAGLLPLAAIWATPWQGNPYAGSPRLRAWILDALSATLRRQHANGSFDSVGPFTQDHGVTLQVANTLTMTVRYLGDAAEPALATRVRDAVRRATRFASRSDEDYAFISNHRALFAVAWLRSGVLLDDEALVRRGDQEIRAILDHQSSEGWYAEYGGADPGYQSLCMAWLAQYQEERPSDELAASMRRAVEFMSNFVHPDGGLGGVYGSRMTSLWFPSGFESLAGSDPVALAVANAVTRGIANGAVVTPETTDIHNLPPLLASYLLAALRAESRAPSSGTPSLPRDDLAELRHFPEAGLVVAGAPLYYAILNVRRGGVGCIFSRATATLAWEDAGYLARSDGRLWSSALALDPEVTVGESRRSVSLRTRFGLAKRDVVTPVRLILLRLANLTLFRSVAVGALLRRLIIERLITRQKAGHLRLSRTIRFDENAVIIQDRVSREGGQVPDALVRARAFTPFHMGSTRYFHPRDLADLADVPMDAGQLSRGGLDRFAEVRFHPSGEIEVSEKGGPAPGQGPAPS